LSDPFKGDGWGVPFHNFVRVRRQEGARRRCPGFPDVSKKDGETELRFLGAAHRLDVFALTGIETKRP